MTMYFSSSPSILTHPESLAELLLHFFNHQTYHRGQVSTLLAQAGIAVGVTDLLTQIPEENNP